jgi:hypothetical protein
MSKARALAALASSVVIAWTAAAAGDAIGPEDRLQPGHRVHVLDRTAIEGRTIIAVGIARVTHGDVEPSTQYTIVDDFPVADPRRLCAVPSDWVIDSPVGQLGPRMLRGARAASGAITEGQDAVVELEALFDQPGVACAPVDAIQSDEAMRARHVEAVEDSVRVVSAEGQALHVELVDVSYQLADHSVVTLPATGGARPVLPAATSAGGCACTALARVPGTGALSTALSLIAIVAMRLRTRRSRR